MSQKYNKISLVLVSLYFLLPTMVYAQKGDKLQHSEELLKGETRNGEKINILTGNVKFTQKNTVIYCDTAYFYREKNAMEAFGNVKIHDLEDSVVITSKRLIYDGDMRVAKLRDNVVYKDDSVSLYTDFLDYDMINNSAKYFNKGRIEDGVNILNSENGLYDTENKLFAFKNDVVLKNPEYTLECEDLVYNIITKIARINSQNIITTKDGTTLVAEEGSEFDTSKDIYDFFSGKINTRSYVIFGKKLRSDKHKQIYTAQGNVEMISKKENLIITGDFAKHMQKTGITKVYGHAIMKKVVGIDTMYLAADTLVSIDDTLDINKRLLAYYNVRIYKEDLQGLSDSLAYFISDSTIYFYDDPILWNLNNQITADTITVGTRNDALDKLHAIDNAFIISSDTTGQFNQIKGKKMVAHFFGKFIYKVDVNGNGESIYYVSNEETGALVGMNHILCSNMLIDFTDNKVHGISFYTNIDASFIPPHEIKPTDTKLKGFEWRDKDKPTLEQIYDYVPPKKEQTEEGQSLENKISTEIMKAKKSIPKKNEGNLGNMVKDAENH